MKQSPKPYGATVTPRGVQFTIKYRNAPHLFTVTRSALQELTHSHRPANDKELIRMFNEHKMQVGERAAAAIDGLRRGDQVDGILLGTNDFTPPL